MSYDRVSSLLGSIGDIPPAEAEERYYRQLSVQAAEPVLL
jgi:hypothetical protein